MFHVPELAYSYSALEPAISADIMELHHSKHHQAYVDKLNTALSDYPHLQNLPVQQLLGSLADLPDAIRTTVQNNGGGHYNHSLYWLCMSPSGGGQPVGLLADAINQRYGSYEQFVEEFTTKALSVFGSGWAWLMPNMDIITTPNQDSPLMRGVYSTGERAFDAQASTAPTQEPLLALDVWEHAYYLDYKNRRTDYIAAWWGVVDWQFVGVRFDAESPSAASSI